MKIKRLVSVFCYYSGIDALFYWFNRRAKRIITFHNVLPPELWQANLANGVSHSLDDFRKIVEIVGRHFSFSTDVLDAKTATITFDDGYHNQYAYAFKTLRKMSIPAIVFVSGDIKSVSSLPPPPPSTSTSLIIDQLLHWVSYAPAEFIPGGDRLQYWVKDVWPRFMKDGAARGQTLMKEFEAKYPYAQIEAQLGTAYRKERLSGITDAEKEEMRKAGWLIGWHTKSHYPLSKLSVAESQDELVGPARYRNVCLSFPYGNPVEVGDTAIKLAEELGYPCAVSNTNTAAQNKSKFFLPRTGFVSSNRYEVEFELSGAKHFLKHRRLLP